MNQKMKLLGLLAIIPVLTVALTFDYAEAKTTIAKSEMGKKLIRAKICGDRLCSEIAGGKQPINVVTEKPKQKETMVEPTVSQEPGSVLKLSRANVPATIPLHKGLYDGKSVYYIITDSSDSVHADLITKSQKWKVELATPLAKTPKAALDPVYMFTNGVKGNGIHGFQDEVFASTPAQVGEYSAVRNVIHASWLSQQDAKILSSAKEIEGAAATGKITLEETQVVLNMPQIVWPEGQMLVKEDKTLTDETSYGGGQILNIDTTKMKVTFIAHRGWGPDGRTIYYIVTDATPEMPAVMMGTVNAPTLAPTIISPAAVDLFQFMNGIKGSGPMGFQAGIAASAPGDENYSPLWRISMIGWKDPSQASVLENISDINALKSAGKINVELARPMDSDHVVNCPFIDPFQ
ncbi:MAG: DUF7482 domain-containing protein [Nitrosopumilaceae archaeon]